MAISRMNMERQLRAGGGIMTLDEPRQGYFLGKIVKKAKRAVKKVVKSPIGKLALLGGGAYLAGGALGGGGGLGNFTKLFAKTKGLFDKGSLLAPLVRDPEGNFSLGRAALTGLGAAGIAAPFFMGGDDEEEIDEGVPVTGVQPMVANIRQQAKDYYSDPTQSALYFMPPKSAVQRSFYAADGGLASLPGYAEGGMIDMGGLEKDYREGGFVPLGAEERADDVPARLSKNEFVFTADAVRNAGGGDIDKGAEIMQNMMDNLEAGGTISEESQGMENPAQEMFDQSQMLESRIA
jgi:hypothetical protein